MKRILLKCRVVLIFYRSILLPNLFFSILILFFMRQAPEAEGNLLELIWFKGIFYGLVLLFAHFLNNRPYYFYYNLGLTRRVLFPAAFLLDAMLFIGLYQLWKLWQ